YSAKFTMDNEARIMELVEEIIDSRASPEEACHEYPHLLPAVRNRLERIRSVQAQIEEGFPPQASSDSPRIAFLRTGRALPATPGYDVLDVVGTGGVGVVYRARHARLNRLVAIKMLLAGWYAGDRELERFTREAQAVAALQHANIVQVFDAGEH